MASLGTAFGTSGATPYNTKPYTFSPSTGNSPFMNALNAASGRTPATVNPQQSLVPPTNQPVKDHTVTSPDGTTVKQTYHPPTPGLIAQPVAGSNTSFTVGDKTYNDTPGGQTVTPTAPTTSGILDNRPAGSSAQVNTPGGPTPSGYTASTPPPAPTPPPPTTNQAATTGLLGYGQGQEAPQVTAARQALEQTQENAANDKINLANKGVELGYGQGETQLLQQKYADIENAQQNALTSALSSQGQQIGALGNAASASAPVNVTPGNALVNPLNGKELYSGLGGLTGLGIAQQNIAQGKSYQQQASDLSTTLSQIDTLTPTITNFLNTSGLNTQGTPFYNQSIKSYIANVKDPSAVASLNAQLADLKTYTAQVLGASGLNPTEVSSTVNSFDPSNLNAEQMTAFISNLKNLGQIRLQPLQQAAQDSYSSGTTPYTGGVASPSSNSSFAVPNNSEVTSLVGNSDLGQGLAGLGLNALGGLEGVMSSIVGTATKILGS